MTTTYTFDENLFSDLHKDAYGFRPKGDYFVWLSTCTDDEKQREWDRLLDALEVTIREEKEEELIRLQEFDNRIASLMHHGARNVAMAIRWLDEAFETNGDHAYLEWNLGIPYGTIAKTLQGNA